MRVVDSESRLTLANTIFQGVCTEVSGIVHAVIRFRHTDKHTIVSNRQYYFI